MRTTVTLDPDVYSFTSAYAGAKGLTLSTAISELIRRAEKVPEPDGDLSRLKCRLADALQPILQAAL